MTVIGRSYRQTFTEGSKRFAVYVWCIKGLIILSGFASVFMVAADCIMLL